MRSAPRAIAPRVSTPRVAGPRFAGPRFSAPRVSAVSIAPSRSFGIAPRGGFASRAVIRPVVGGRAVVARGYAPRFIGPRIVVAPYRFARPFYAFRPRFSVGFGLWVGFPVAYPYYYDYPYSYGYPYPAYPYPYPAYPYAAAGQYGYPPSTYGYPASPYPYPAASSYPAQPYPPSSSGYPTATSGVEVYPPQESASVPRRQDAGGVSFEITPSTARVIVDGIEVGSVAEFSATSAPLTLTLGRHHIELRAAGYQTMAFEAEIVAGQVIPYRGEMQPQR